MNDPIAPAQGDRIDFAGKYPQFRLFAAKVYDELANNNLAWIKIGDPNAGNLDDIQFATHTEIHAFQVKWSATNKPPAFRYKEFIQLLPNMVSSWRNLVLANKDENKRLRVYLLSNRLPSENDQLKINDSVLGNFRQFIENVWKPIQGGNPLSMLHPKWHSFLAQELATYQLDQEEFVEFIQACALTFGNNLPERSLHRHYQAYKKDTDEVFDFILDELHNPARRIHFTASELRTRLHWEERSREIFSHDFFVDPTQYEPNSATIANLSSAVDRLSGGYIFVQGGPGTGKSTLLTEWAKVRKERVIRYFIYLNQGGANGRTSTRGDALHLFHDLSIQLANQGIFKEGIIHTNWDLGQMQSVFSRQLIELKQNYQQTGQKSIIIVDGLDHIPREYHPNQNLLHYLPPPNDIPTGVYFVLGSQTYELRDLFTPVRQAYDQLERRVEMKALNKATVEIITTRKLNLPLPQTLQDQIFQRSAGHPLYLSYILRGLSSIDVNKVAERLKLFPLIDGDVELYYDSIWREFANNETFVELMGLIARLRYGVHLQMLTEWGLSHTQKLLLKQLLDQFFDQFFGYRSFFHNSFRQYLIRKTATDILTNQFDEQQDKRFYAELAERAHQSSNRLFNHDYPYHLYQAGHYDTFTKVVSSGYFDEQRHRFRPIEQMIEDLRLGLTIAVQKRRLDKLLEYGFLMAEMQNRTYHQEQSQFFALFPQLLPLEHLAEYALTLSSEQVKPTFQLVRLLYRNGYRSEARKLFALKEPIELSKDTLILSGQFNSYSREDDVLTEWIRTVALWTDSAILVQKIFSLAYPERSKAIEHKSVAENEKKTLLRLKSIMMEALIDSLSAVRETRSQAKTVLQQLYELQPKNIHFQIRLSRILIDDYLADGDMLSANEALTQLLNQLSNTRITSTTWRTSIAELIYQVRRDQTLVRNWLEGITTVEGSDEEYLSHYDEDTFDVIQTDFWFIMLKTYIGQPVQLQDYFKTKTRDENDGHEVLVNWKRMAGKIAQLAGASGNESHLNIKEVLPIIRFYYTKPRYEIHHHYWYYAVKGRFSYFHELVRAIGLYGHRAVKQAAVLFEQEFVKHPTHWPAKLKQQIWLDLGHQGLPPEQIKVEISRAETSLLDEERDVMSRQEEAFTQAELWLSLDEPELAKQWAERSLDESFGIHSEKDYQLSDWVGWLKQVNEIESSKASERIRWLVGYLSYIRQVTESAAAESLADELVDAAWRWNNHAGIKLFNWSLKHGYTKLEDGLSSLLQTLLVTANEKAIPCITNFYGQVFLYNSSYVYKTPFKQIVMRIKQHADCDKLLSQLLLDIDRYSLPENRPKYSEILNELNILYNPSRFIHDDNESYKRNTVTKIHIGDQEPMSNKAVAALVNNLDELKAVTQQARLTRNGGIFDWTPVLQKVKPELIKTGVETMFDALPKDEHIAFNLLTDLAELAQEINQIETARTIANLLLSDERGGWLIDYDSGKRFAAYSILTQLDGSPACNEAWNDFARSYISSGNVSYLRDLNRILPVINPKYDVCEVWTQIEQYIKRMMDQAKWDDSIPILEGHEALSPETCLAIVALHLADSNEKGVSESAQLFFAHQLATEQPAFTTTLIEYFPNANDFGRLMFTRMLLFLSKYHPTLLNQFKQPIQQLLSDRLFNVRASAFQLWEQLGETPPSVGKLVSPLPWGSYWRSFNQGVFYISFNENQSWLDGEIEADAVLNYLDDQLSLITELTEIPELILGQRVIEILDAELSNNNSVLAQQMRANDYGVEAVSFPYTLLTDYLLNVVLGELVIHGYFPDWRKWHGIAPFFDPDLWKIKHQSWPSFMKGILSEKDFNYSTLYSLSEDWVFNAKQALDQLTSYHDDQVILGERSFFRGLGWEYDTELRESCVDFIANGKQFGFGNGAFINYNRLMLAEIVDCPSLILANHGMNLFDTPQNISTWLVFNSSIAAEMGWRLSGQGFFRWIDDNDKVMVESIFWTDGNTRMKPPHFGGETGSGWLVLASQGAFSQLRIRYKLEQRQYVHRWNRVKSTHEPRHKEASRIITL